MKIWFLRTKSEKFNRYYSLPGNGNDSTERRDVVENGKWKPHLTRKSCKQYKHLSVTPKI